MTLFTYPSENSPAPQAKTGSRLVLWGWAWSRGTSWLVSSIAVAWLEEDFFPKPNTILAVQYNKLGWRQVEVRVTEKGGGVFRAGLYGGFQILRPQGSDDAKHRVGGHKVKLIHI